MLWSKRLGIAVGIIASLGSIANASYRPGVWGSSWKRSSFLVLRGGESAAAAETTKEELSLDQKVKNAMKKLGLSQGPTSTDEQDDCEGGACPLPSSTDAATNAEGEKKEAAVDVNPYDMAKRIAQDMNVAEDLAMAAIGATSELLPGNERRLDEDAARAMIQQELDVIANIPADSKDVELLVKEGHDAFLSRRALAFADGNLEDARAILVADEMDAEREKEEEEAKSKESPASPSVDDDVLAQLRKEKEEKQKEEKKQPPKSEFKTVSVNADFDPTAGGISQPAPAPQNPGGVPPPAKKSDVVFEATAAQIQELVLESPVPVLLDVYADWCGPCKHLTPLLEEMAVKAGGAFRLVKVNTDNERAVSGALEVKALPTVFAVRNGRVLNNFEGMPRSEEMMKGFMMGLLMEGADFTPPLSADDKKRYAELTSKLVKTAGAASFTFAARERLQDRMSKQLQELVKAYDGNMLDAEDSANTLRSLFSNVIRKPDDAKYRRVNLQNKVIAAKIAAFPPCIAMLKYVGFVKEADGSAMTIGKGKKVVNVAPLTVARDAIDKWIDRNRHTLAAAARKRKDEEERARLAAEAALNPPEEEEEDEEVEVDPDAVTLKVRLEGKKKVHELALHADDPLQAALDALPVKADQDGVQIVCASKKLVVKASDAGAMAKTLREHKLVPAASLVVKLGNVVEREASSSLKDRASAQKSKKKGSHTMQSVGIYAKDDNAKGELIDGGGGTLFEHDVTDSEDEGESVEMDEADDDQEEEEAADDEE